MRKITIALLGLVLLTTLKHSAFSYLHITPVGFGVAWLDWAYSVLVVLVLDAAILYTSFRGRVGLARIAAVSVGALSLAAFMDRADEFTWVQWITVTVFSVIIPFLQYEFAEIFAQDARSESELDKALARIAELELITAKIRSTQVELESVKTELESGLNELESVKAELESAKAELIGKDEYLSMISARLESAHAEIESLSKYRALDAALRAAPIVLGHNKILIEGSSTSSDGLVVPFEVVGNSDKRYRG